MQIAGVELSSPLIAAPLAGYSNPVYRLLCHEHGAGLVVSEMISDKALHYHNAKTEDMCRIDPREHPVSLQLFGGDPDTMAEAARYLEDHTDCEFIDINMGCPVTKVIKAHGGSWLMAHEDTAVEVASAVVNAVSRPVTVKMRAGWDKDHINCARLARRLENVGVQAIAVHGRTKGQMYQGKSDNQYIRMVKEAVSIPVIGNGDIHSYEDVQRMKEETGCDGFMIGRGLLGNPWLLDEINAQMRGKTYEAPSDIERIHACMEYAEKLCAYHGERNGIREMRGMSGWYLTAMPDAASIRRSLAEMNTLEQMRHILQNYEEKLTHAEALP